MERCRTHRPHSRPEAPRRSRGTVSGPRRSHTSGSAYDAAKRKETVHGGGGRFGDQGHAQPCRSEARGICPAACAVTELPFRFALRTVRSPQDVVMPGQSATSARSSVSSARLSGAGGRRVRARIHPIRRLGRFVGGPPPPLAPERARVQAQFRDKTWVLRVGRSENHACAPTRPTWDGPASESASAAQLSDFPRASPRQKRASTARSSRSTDGVGPGPCSPQGRADGRARAHARQPAHGPAKLPDARNHGSANLPVVAKSGTPPKASTLTRKQPRLRPVKPFRFRKSTKG